MSLWRRILTERRLVVVPLLTALVINLLIIGLAVVPLTRSVAGDETRAGDVKLALAEAHRAARVANDTKASQVQAGDELSRFYADVLPSSLAEARSLLYLDLSDLARETGLTYGSGIFESEEVEDSPLIRYSTDVTLAGEYAGIRRFLYQLDTSKKFRVVERVALGQSGQQSGQLRGGTGSLEVVLQMATYYSRTPPAPTGGGQ